MKRITVFAAIVVACILLAGCATVKVYSDAGLNNETGLRFYTLSSPQFMRVKPGLGASEVKMGFKNSALESYGVVADSKLPEGLEAFAAVLSKSAYATQAFTGPAPGGTTDQDQIVPFRLYEVLTTPAGTVLKEVLP